MNSSFPAEWNYSGYNGHNDSVTGRDRIMSVILLVFVTIIASASCFTNYRTFSDSDAAVTNVDLQVTTEMPECERVTEAGGSRPKRNVTEQPPGETFNVISAIGRFLQSNDTGDESLENCVEVLSDYLVADYLTDGDGENKTVTAITARMKMSGFMFNPYMMIPQLIMMGFAPILLANLKMLVMNALMINNMALSSAIFMTVRNIVFGPKLGGQTKYVNYGYRKPSGHKHHHHHHPHHY